MSPTLQPTGSVSGFFPAWHNPIASSPFRSCPDPSDLEGDPLLGTHGTLCSPFRAFTTLFGNQFLPLPP